MGETAKAIVMMVACCALLAATTLIGKVLGGELLGNGLSPFQVSAARFIFGFLALSPLILYHRPSLKGAPWPLYLSRTFFGWSNVTLIFAAVNYLPLADATAISFLSPVITMLLAIVLLRETIGAWRWGAAAIALVGGLILLRPGTSAFQPAAFLALLAALLMGCEMILIKILSRREPPLRILLVANGAGSVISLAAAAFVWINPSVMQWLAMALLGAIMVSAQSLFIQSMRRADASVVSPVFYMTLVFAVIYDIILFDVWPAAASMTGSILIIAAAVTVAWRENIRRNI